MKSFMQGYICLDWTARGEWIRGGIGEEAGIPARQL